MLVCCVVYMLCYGKLCYAMLVRYVYLFISGLNELDSREPRMRLEVGEAPEGSDDLPSLKPSVDWADHPLGIIYTLLYAFKIICPLK